MSGASRSKEIKIKFCFPSVRTVVSEKVYPEMTIHKEKVFATVHQLVSTHNK